MFRHETRRRKEPSALSKLIIRPVVEYLEVVNDDIEAQAVNRLTTLSISMGVSAWSASLVLLMSFSG